MTFLALFLFSITAVYWSFRPDINFLQVKQDVVNYIPWRTIFYFHIFAGMLSIAIGPFQFLKFIRDKFRLIHRSLGKIYVGVILLIGAPSGLYMAFFAEGGMWSSLGFTAMSFLWFITTYVAYKKVREKDFAAHEQWMIRSYAVTFSAVTLRLWVPFLSVVVGMGHELVIVLTAWISWLLNLLFAELLIHRKIKSNVLTTKT